MQSRGWLAAGYPTCSPTPALGCHEATRLAELSGLSCTVCCADSNVRRPTAPCTCGVAATGPCSAGAVRRCEPAGPSHAGAHAQLGTRAGLAGRAATHRGDAVITCADHPRSLIQACPQARGWRAAAHLQAGVISKVALVPRQEGAAADVLAHVDQACGPGPAGRLASRQMWCKQEYPCKRQGRGRLQPAAGSQGPPGCATAAPIQLGSVDTAAPLRSAAHAALHASSCRQRQTDSSSSTAAAAAVTAQRVQQQPRQRQQRRPAHPQGAPRPAPSPASPSRGSPGGRPGRRSCRC